MTDKDNEIIKALECCKTPKCSNCEECPQRGLGTDCLGELITNTITLINRQRAEIETLKDTNEHLAVFLEESKSEIERLHSILLSFTSEVSMWSNKKGYDTSELSLIPILGKAKNIKAEIRSEAIKEFAERLKKEVLFDSGWGVMQPDVIDNLVKEMTETDVP